MRLRQIGSNQCEITTEDGTVVLFSYNTPVAAWTAEGTIRTEEHYSATTSRHINKYLGGKDIGKKVPQKILDALLTTTTAQSL